MTIHKSKGLEFPVCFAAGLSGTFSFRRKDTSAPVLYDGDWGLGINYFDVTSRVRSSTLRRTEIGEKIKRDSMGEELRVLYVAMTRAICSFSWISLENKNGHCWQNLIWEEN